MKKIFFFLLTVCLPITVSAGSIKELTIENGTLSRKFESNNNTYSILLEEGFNSVKFDYILEEETAEIKIDGNEYMEGEENKATIEVELKDGSKEIYTFFLEKEDTTPVFNEYNPVSTASIEKEIPHLKLYVILGCAFLIIILFKCIVLGFKK